MLNGSAELDVPSTAERMIQMGTDHDYEHRMRRQRPTEPDGATLARPDRARDSTWSRDGRWQGETRRPLVPSVRSREGGIRRMRVVSNWTAAALVAGTGVGAVALATHSSLGLAGSAGASGTRVTGGAPVTSGPHVAGTVVTSGGSGATVTTTTRVVNGRTVITYVRHPAAYHDS